MRILLPSQDPHILFNLLDDGDAELTAAPRLILRGGVFIMHCSLNVITLVLASGKDDVFNSNSQAQVKQPAKIAKTPCRARKNW